MVTATYNGFCFKYLGFGPDSGKYDIGGVTLKSKSFMEQVSRSMSNSNEEAKPWASILDHNNILSELHSVEKSDFFIRDFFTRLVCRDAREFSLKFTELGLNGSDVASDP